MNKNALKLTTKKLHHELLPLIEQGKHHHQTILHLQEKYKITYGQAATLLGKAGIWLG